MSKAIQKVLDKIDEIEIKIVRQIWVLAIMLVILFILILINLMLQK